MKGLSIKEKKERIKNFRPIDDVFFEVIAESEEVCEEILQTILEDKNLTVDNVIVQSSKKNIYGKSVRLDALCTLGDGTKCNIEVQRTDNDDHLRRARFNASSITVKESQVGERYENVTELFIVYISEFDIFKENKTIYHVEKVLRETGTVIEDGLHEIFVNTKINDGSNIADLMSCFTKKEFDDSKFPKFSARVRELKTTEGGANVVCEVMEKYMAESRAEGKAEGKVEGRIDMLVTLAKKNLLSVVDAALEANMSEEEFLTLMEQKQ